MTQEDESVRPAAVGAAVPVRAIERFLELSPDLFAIVDADGRFERVNAAWTRALGWTAEELAAMPYTSLFDDRACAEVLGAVGGGVFEREARLRTKGGDYRRFVVRVHAPDDEGGVVYVVASDVDERREVDEARRQAEADLRVRSELEALVTSMSSRFLDAHSDELPATVRDALAGIARLHDIDRAYLVKADPTMRAIELYEEWWAEGSPRKVTPVAELPQIAQRFWVGKLFLGEVVCFASLDESPVAEVAEALAADDVQSILFLPLQRREATIGFFGFEGRRRPCVWAPEEIALMRTVGELFVSATDRAVAEAALEATAAELEQRNVELERSNADLEHFASIVSHDLKSPLQVVRGFVDLLGRVAIGQTTATGDDAQSYLDAAQRGVTRMNALIDDLLAYSRAGRGPAERVPVDLDAVAREAVHDLSETIEAVGADVSIGTLPTVEGDGSQLAQLFQNLIANAVKFHRHDMPCVVEVIAERAGDEWQITVADNGIGVSGDDRDRIFEMFTRAHGADRFPGSGVGLAVSKRVVENHGGRIWVDDSPDGGSRFVFTLPVID